MKQNRLRSGSAPQPLTRRIAAKSTVICLLLAAAFPFGAPSRAANLTWDPANTTNGGIINDGSGDWNAANVWNNGVGNQTWASGDKATFTGAVGGTVTGNASTNGVTVGGAGGYTFSGVLSGAGALTKTGSSTLVLSGANTFTGGINVNAGTLSVNGDAALGDAGNGVVMAGGTQLISTGPLASTRVVTLTSGSITLSGRGVGSARFTGAGGVTALAGVTLSNNANDYTGQTQFAGTAGNYSFSSIADLGVASSLGAPTTVANGTVLLAPTTSGSAVLIYTGTGNSSNRDWVLQLVGGSQARLRNLGSGTLTLTGNISLPGTGVSTAFFDAVGANLQLLGAISNGAGVRSVAFSGSVGRSITLGGANTYNGTTSISGVTVQAPVLANRRVASSFGTAAAVIVSSIGISSNGVVSYTGAGASTDRGWIISNGTLSNDGNGALALSGAMAITNSATLGGSFSGAANSISSVISGAGTLAVNGAGTWMLTAANTYSGGTSIAAGTLQLGNGGTSGSILGDVADYGTLVFNRSDTAIFAGVVSGTGALEQMGPGTTILTANNTYTGGTSISPGTLQLGNGGTSGSILGNVADNGTLAFNHSDTVMFAGVVSGTGALEQMGPGTTILTANNTYTGSTTISAGALQLGNGGAIGSIISNVTDNGSLLFDRSDNVTFNAIVSGSGNLVQNGSGTIILGGINTYSGDTIVNSGTLLVNSSQALGVGNVVVNGGVLGADPQPINVGGNYTQNAGGTLQLNVTGPASGQYDFLHVGGNAALGGTLRLISLGYRPSAGDQLTLVSTGGVVSGRFAQFEIPFSAGPGFNAIDLIYGENFVELRFLNLTAPVSPGVPTAPKLIETVDFSSFALTPNETAAGNLLDQIQLNPKAAALISFLFNEPFSNLPGDLEKISPDGLTAFDEISFSNANIQRLTLEGRLDDLRSGSSGFSSNMKLNGATTSKASVDGKSSKGVVEPVLQPSPENRWGVWVTGFGDFVNVDSDSNANGYDFTTGGFTVGVDYRITDQLAIGAMGEYAYTWTSLKPSGEIDVNSGRGGMYATWFNHGIYLNGAIYGGHNSYSSSRSTLGGMASGGTGGAEFSTFISGGYDLQFSHLTIGPIAALQYTYVNIDGFSEHGSLAALDIHSQSAESLRTDFGFRAFYLWQVGQVVVEPSLSAAWEHEYKYSALPITAGFAGIPGTSATFFGPSEGHDSAIVSAGVSVHWTPAIATYVNYDGQLGRDRYDSNAVTGGVRISF